MKRSVSPVSVRVASMVQRLSALDQLARVDAVLVADVAGEVVLLDHLAHVAAGSRPRWRSAGPSTA